MKKEEKKLKFKSTTEIVPKNCLIKKKYQSIQAK
jgi:hypothetical protein